MNSLINMEREDIYGLPYHELIELYKRTFPKYDEFHSAETPEQMRENLYEEAEEQRSECVALSCAQYRREAESEGMER